MTVAGLFTAPRRVLTGWSFGVGVLLVLAALSDLALARYAAYRNAHDYRRPLAEVAAHWNSPGFSPAAAMDGIERALTLAPERPEPRVMLGHLQYRLGQWKQAIAAYESAIALGATETGLRQNIVWCLVELGEFAEAAKRGARALKEGHDDPLLHRYTAEALFRAGRFEEARSHYESALAANSEDRHLMNRLVEVYVALGEDAAARSMEQRISDAEARLGTLGTGGP